MIKWVILGVVVLSIAAINTGCDDPISDVMDPDTLSFEARLSLEEDSIDQFIAEQGFDSVFVTPNGLRIIPLTEGNGNLTRPGDILSIDYTGSFLFGRIFDTTDEDVAMEAGIFVEGNTYLPFVTNIGNPDILAGWNEGLFYMDEHSKVILILPSHLAYGEGGFGQLIGPFRILKFELALVKIRR